MVSTAITIGILLILLGLGGYVGTGRESVTALIPLFFGLAIAGLGLAGRRPEWRKHALHGATVLALLGLLGSARGMPATVRLLQGQQVARPAAAVAQALMALICLVFVILAVRSFAAARRGGVPPVEWHPARTRAGPVTGSS